MVGTKEIPAKFFHVAYHVSFVLLFATCTVTPMMMGKWNIAYLKKKDYDDIKRSRQMTTGAYYRDDTEQKIPFENNLHSNVKIL